MIIPLAVIWAGSRAKVFLVIFTIGKSWISGDWYFTAVVNGAPTGSSCAPTGQIVDPRTGSGHVMTCDVALEVSVAEGSTISIQSYWNASRHRKDDVQGDIDWAINYSLGLPLN